MTKTKLKAISIFLVIAMLLVAIFVANFACVHHAFAEEAEGAENSGESGLLAGLMDNMVTVIIVGVVFVAVVLPLIILGIVASVLRNRK